MPESKGGRLVCADRSETEKDDMCQALRDLMSDEIEKELEQKETDTVIGNIKKMMKNLQISAGQAMNALEIPVSEQSKYIALL